MALTVNTVGDQPYIPGSVGYLYISDQLIAGDLKMVTAGSVTITGAALLPRGTVLGKMTLGAITSAAKAGGNTGNGTITAISAGTKTASGVYQVRFTSATAYIVTAPNGVSMPAGTNGAYANPMLNFTTTAGGTPFVAGDGFDVTVTVGSNAYKKAVATAVDGSQNPAAILAEVSDATLADVNAGVYLTGEFNENRVYYDPSFTLQQVRDAFRPLTIFLKSAITADPAS